MLEKTQIWREHESAACLIHLWILLDNSITCQAAKGSNCPLFENSIRCPLTQFDDDCPLAEDVEKQLNVAFAMMKVAHCCFGCRSPTGEFADAQCWWQMPTGWWRCPLAALDDIVKTFSLKTTLNSPLCQLRGETSSAFHFWILNSPPLGVGKFHCYTPSFRCMRVPSSIDGWLQYVWVNSIAKLVQSSGCGWPFPRFNPWIIYI